MSEAIRFRCNLSSSRRLVVIVAAAVAISAFAPSAIRARKKKPLQTVKGTWVSIERKGRTTILTLETESNEKKEFIIRPRVKFSVTASGDDEFLAPGQFVSAKAVLTNNRLFGKRFTVHVGRRSRKRRDKIVKASNVAGESVNTYSASGQILSRQPNKQDPDYETITLKVGGKQGTPVFLDKGYTVTVSSDDPEMAKLGSAVELEGRPLRGGRFNVTKVTVKLSTSLKAKVFFAPAERKQ